MSNVELFSSKEGFKKRYLEACKEQYGKSFERCSLKEKYYILAKLVARESNEIREGCKERCAKNKQKKVYYFSMEFLIGKLLENYLINYEALDMVKEAMSELGENLEDVLEQERDAGLGNGGLGRLAACFIDSLASLGYTGNGNGIRYRYGLFKQDIKDGRQVELPDNWLEDGYPWETVKREDAVLVRFGGEVVTHYEENRFWRTWEGGEKILAVPYDVPVVGYKGETVNNLRLWSAEPAEENFDMDAFNRGDYSGAMKYRSDIEAITSILYPNDSSDPGKVLRLKQEYMFVAAGINNIVKNFKLEHGTDWNRFPELISIHTNDTHPALCAPELLRILIDEEGLDWDTAWYVTSKTISYTNHTILPEALEKWPIDMFRKLLPRVFDFVEEIDRRYRESFPRNLENWQQLLEGTAILWDGQVRMANLSIIAGHTVNGVAALHTEILKHNVLKDFYTLKSDMFQNKTNGITHRRFLAQANPSFSKLITEKIGNEWMSDASELEKLLKYKDDTEFLKAMDACKKENKKRLADYIEKTSGVVVDCNSIFDIQVKRFHAYKRQLLNVLKIMYLYDRIINEPEFDMHPTTFIFAGKAAQGYAFAKDVIRLVNSVADVVNNDERVKGRIKVAFVPNFSVSNAQYIYPAADISEQISTAGMEASGTGNMKFMMNGAITLGTLDGANVEISEQVGMENIEIFGLRSERVDQYRAERNYFAWDEYNNDAGLRKIMDQLIDGTYANLSGDFQLIFDNVMRSNDEFFVLKDFRSYMDAWHHLEKLYSDREAWNKVALHNTAKSGFFSSDRTIRQYAEEIWKL